MLHIITWKERNGNPEYYLSSTQESLAKFKEIAYRQQKAVSKLMVEMMEETVINEEGYRVARDHHLRRLDTGVDLKTKGTISWKRDDLHER